MKKTIWLIAALSLFCGNTLAQESDALPFTRIDRNPVTSAFAGAGYAFNGSAAYSAFGGAAVLPFYLGTLDAAVSYQCWTPSLSPSNNVSAGAAYKITPRVGLSLGYSLGNGASYKVYEAPGEPSGVFFPKHHVIALGLGAGITDNLSLGINVRYAREIPAPGKVYAGANADVFVAYRFNGGLLLSAGLSTLGTRVAENWQQPASLKAAVNWGTVLGEDHALNLLADADYYFSGNYSVAAGVQYGWKSLIFVRAGYHLASENCVIPSHLGLGLGIHFYGFSLDVSYLTASFELANTINLGLSYSF